MRYTFFAYAGTPGKARERRNRVICGTVPLGIKDK